MKLIIRLMKPVAVLAGLLLVMPMVVMADKPDAGAKGGKPNQNSVATTAACANVDDTVRVCSCKGLSNVVLWCGKETETWVKHENFDSGVGTGEVYDATLGCVDDEGNSIPGPITMIAIKSGSQKNAKHYREGYLPVEGAPSGSGLFTTTPDACPIDPNEFVCPVAGDCKEGNGDDGGDEPPADEDPFTGG